MHNKVLCLAARGVSVTYFDPPCVPRQGRGAEITMAALGPVPTTAEVGTEFDEAVGMGEGYPDGGIGTQGTKMQTIQDCPQIGPRHHH